MATAETVHAMLNTFALQWRYDFNPDVPTWPALVELWEQRLRPVDDDVLSQVTSQVLDELKKAPTIADIRERCQTQQPRTGSRPEYLDDLPRRDYAAATEARAVNQSIRQRYDREIKAAAAGWGKLLDELREARKAGDDGRMARATAAIEEARSPAAYRRWQAYWMDRAEPGSSERQPALAETCPTCRDQGYVLVPYNRVRGLPFHWTPVPKSPNAPGNTTGALYYCPTCVTPTREERAA